jgi:hypothetical protein
MRARPTVALGLAGLAVGWTMPCQTSDVFEAK